VWMTASWRPSRRRSWSRLVPSRPWVLARWLAHARPRPTSSAFGEDHSFPEPGWAEALERAWQDGHGAVGAVLENANPGVLSWVDMLLNFGPHIALTEGGARPSLAWHNTSYRRADLLAFGDDLGRLMTVEALLQQALVAQGRTLHMEVRAVRTTSTSRSSPRSWRPVLGQPDVRRLPSDR